MEKNISEDGTYKFIYKLPSNKILDFEFSFKKDENFETCLYENFENEKIPKVILDDINPLMEYFLFEERKELKFYNKSKREKLNSKYFLQDTINKWKSIKTLKNHIERKFIYDI